MDDFATSGSEIRIRQLEALRAVARTGSFTAAGRLLGISQPAVSRLIRSLSASTGLTLFRREEGQSVPTPEARLLLAEAGRVLDMMADLGSLHLDLHDEAEEHLRIGCLPGLATTYLPGVLAEVMASRGEVRVTLETDRPEGLLDLIVRGQCEVAITAEFAGGHPAVQARRFPIRAVCVLPPDHPLAGETEITPAMLRRQNLIGAGEGDAFGRSVLSAFETCGITPLSCVETGQCATACRLVAEGVGVAIVNELDAREFAWTGLVRRPFFPTVAFNLDVLHSRLARSTLVGLELLDALERSLHPFRAS